MIKNIIISVRNSFNSMKDYFHSSKGIFLFNIHEGELEVLFTRQFCTISNSFPENNISTKNTYMCHV